MLLFQTANSKLFHILKDKINNPPFPYNKNSIKMQAYCNINCEERTSSVMEYSHLSNDDLICKRCLDKYSA
jgi:hypothetical protein